MLKVRNLASVSVKMGLDLQDSGWEASFHCSEVILSLSLAGVGRNVPTLLGKSNSTD